MALSTNSVIAWLIRQQPAAPRSLFRFWPVIASLGVLQNFSADCVRFVDRRRWNRTSGLLNDCLLPEAQEMVQRQAFAALIGAVLLLAGGASMAADYRPDEFLSLDLPKALLSPRRLGPPAEFVRVPLEGKGDVAKNDARKTDAPKNDVATNDHSEEPARPARGAVPHRSPALAHARIEKPRGSARTKLAHRHGDPLDAQARDTRIQTWPCNSGGICNWKQ
jgi:hypothetical protein